MKTDMPPRTTYERPTRVRVRWGRLIAVLLVLGMLLGGGLYAVNTLIGGSGAATQAQGPVTVTIPQGATADRVARILEDEGVISSAFSFRLKARFDDRASAIIPGEYQLRPGMSSDEILSVLATPPEAAPTFKVTIPEGLTVEQTLERIAEAKASPFSKKQLTQALGKIKPPAWVPKDLPAEADPFEGLLFPNTYDFTAASTPASVLQTLVDQTDEVMSGISTNTDLSPYQILVAASLIEREARIREEQAKIASVIENRLDEGIALQIDATVLYALGEHKDRVLYEDLEVDSPWNTYKYPGLPPTPISGAGQAAIQAAANPAETKFLYYVVVDPATGKHAFSETYEEFLRNRDEARANG